MSAWYLMNSLAEFFPNLYAYAALGKADQLFRFGDLDLLLKSHRKVICKVKSYIANGSCRSGKFNIHIWACFGYFFETNR